VRHDVSAQAVGAGTPLRFLPQAIRVPERPLRAIATGWLTAFPVSMAFAVLGALMLPQAEQPQFHVNGAAAIFALVVFSPVVETLIMGTVLLVLLRFVPAVVAIAASAVGWGIAHSMVAPIWGLVIWWPFLVFSTLFVAWRRRSLLLAFAIPMCVHALQNLIPALLVAYGAGG
jgi:hypothetical protein